MMRRFISSAVGPRLTMTFSNAEESGSSNPSRMNIRQKSFFVVGLCNSNTEPIPPRACTTRSVCSAKSSSRRSTRTLRPRHLQSALADATSQSASIDVRDEHLQRQYARVAQELNEVRGLQTTLRGVLLGCEPHHDRDTSARDR